MPAVPEHPVPLSRRRPRRRWLLLAIVALGAVYAVGMASNLISREACASRNRQITLDFLAGSLSPGEVTWLMESQLSDELLRRPVPREDLVGEYRTLSYFLPLRMRTPDPDLETPWAYSIPETTPWPFIVRVDYGRRAQLSYGTCGSAGTELYLAFFGLAHRLGDWPSVMW